MPFDFQRLLRKFIEVKFTPELKVSNKCFIYNGSSLRVYTLRWLFKIRISLQLSTFGWRYLKFSSNFKCDAPGQILISSEVILEDTDRRWFRPQIATCLKSSNFLALEMNEIWVYFRETYGNVYQTVAYSFICPGEAQNYSASIGLSKKSSRTLGIFNFLILPLFYCQKARPKKWEKSCFIILIFLFGLCAHTHTDTQTHKEMRKSERSTITQVFILREKESNYNLIPGFQMLKSFWGTQLFFSENSKPSFAHAIPFNTHIRIHTLA